ncbi:hypothetical protein OCH239_16120 [Roseivivax halodurans JCM 10272]|uniref:Asparagine synthetase domain-containing protein n=1 Tax=Roseivivax halodurans JCM 10272 TaxID=1449350 RepID=X7EJZ6_9RHOB|nr:hypothetical protein [Roseivivax halodurans]ETX15496.1 hypothetical protein OCH239_16120 [Roseivivax halodurans JCM 10272]
MTRLFLIDDRTLPEPGAQLHGFAWEGADFVIGTEGLAAFEAGGRRLPWSADGDHVLVRREGGGIGIGADFAGCRHLFYWSEGRDWAVCESFIDLVAHLRGRGVALHEDIAQTGAFLSRKQLFQQLTTDRTAVREIACLDAGARIEIGPDGLVVIPPDPVPAEDYAAALDAFIATWLSRMATLRAAPDLALHVHLSGGFDSRAVAAFHVWLERNEGSCESASVRSLTDARHADDLKIAEEIAAASGIRLNHNPPRPGRALSLEEALTSWRHHSAGAYTPVRVPASFGDPRDVHFSGHASSGYKYTFDDAAARRTIRRMERAYGYFGRGDRPRWRSALEAHLGRLEERTGSLGRAWGCWQRVNRARFHAGQAATYKTQVAIFHSRSASRLDAARRPLTADFQLYHDILASLAPEMMEVPFDDAAKAPGEAVRAALTVRQPAPPVPGRVWGAFEPAQPGGTPLSRSKLARALLDEVDAGWSDLPRRRVTLLFRWHIARLRRRIRAGRAPHAVKMRHLHSAWLLIRLSQLGVRMDGPGQE